MPQSAEVKVRAETAAAIRQLSEELKNVERGSQLEITRARELQERAEQLGIRLEYLDGFVVVRLPSTEDPYAVEAFRMVIESLGKHIVAVQRLAIRRAQAERCAEFIGERIFVPQGEMMGTPMVATLESVEGDGSLVVSYQTTIGEKRRELTSSCHADGCLITVGAVGAENGARSRGI